MNDNILELDEVKTSTLIYLPFKRLLDIFFSLIGLVLFIIFSIIIKVCYLITGDKAPIIFIHKRIGKNGQEFNMYKFRTMVPNAPELLKNLLKDKKKAKEWNDNHKLNDDPRITKVGRFLRKSSIDELPQFINVLIGNMSLIGPRPLVKEEVDAYGNQKDLLLSVKPGITGNWACNGRSNTTVERRRKLELDYVKNCSLLLDIKIFFKTILKVLQKEGAK